MATEVVAAVQLHVPRDQLDVRIADLEEGLQVAATERIGCSILLLYVLS
jgi:hypothetical protein